MLAYFVYYLFKMYLNLVDNKQNHRKVYNISYFINGKRYEGVTSLCLFKSKTISTYFYQMLKSTIKTEIC